jgi:aspartate aminotransferase
MTMRFAERMSRLGGEGAFEVLARTEQLESEGRSIVHLEIGEPDFATPDNIIESAVDALQSGYTHYTPAGGMRPAREALARFVQRRMGVPVDSSEVVLVPGSKNIVLFTLLACVDPDDEVIHPDPGYPAYKSLIEFVGARPVPVRLREDCHFRMDLDELQRLITPRTKLLIINSPHNPTGAVLPAADVAAIARLAQEHDLLVLSDEIYSHIVYEQSHVSVFAQPGMRERTVLMDGVSKSHAMCGWRLGYAVAPRPLAARFELLMVNSSSCAAAFTQMAAIEAWQAPESEVAVEHMVTLFRERRDLLIDGLNRLPGIRCHPPQGAFYAFPNIEATGMDESTLARGLLEEAGVALLAGTAFGSGGRGFLRIAYTQGEEAIREALERIKSFLSANRAVP